LRGVSILPTDSTPTPTATPTATPTSTSIDVPVSTATQDEIGSPKTTVRTPSTDTPTETAAATPTEPSATESTTPRLVINDQTAESGNVTVTTAAINRGGGGFVVLYRANSFRSIEGPAAGVAQLTDETPTESVPVELTEQKSDRYTALLVADSNDNGEFERGIDTGALQDGQVVADTAQIVVEDPQQTNGSTPADASAPETTGSNADRDEPTSSPGSPGTQPSAASQTTAPGSGSGAGGPGFGILEGALALAGVVAGLVVLSRIR
jgi:hypothetical protein